MKPAFPGFPEEGIKFLRGLKRNNNRDWFQPRKEIFDQQLKAPMTELVTVLSRAMAEFAPDYISLDPAKAIYRIYRDTRFSNDKTPYKTHIAAFFWHRQMNKDISPGYYFGVSPDNVQVGGGSYMVGPTELLRIRNSIADDYETFHKIAGHKEIRKRFGGLHGDSLTRVPKGFAADHPAAEWLKKKQFFVYVELDPKLATSPKLAAELLAHFKAMAPLIDFLAHSVRPASRSTF